MRGVFAGITFYLPFIPSVAKSPVLSCGCPPDLCIGGRVSIPMSAVSSVTLFLVDSIFTSSISTFVSLLRCHLRWPVPFQLSISLKCHLGLSLGDGAAQLHCLCAN